MGELLFKTGDFLLSTAIKRMLTGAGLTLITAGVSIKIIENLVAQLQKGLSGLPDLALSLLGLSGCDVALSLMLSAILTRVAIENARIYLGHS